jgi:integrase
MTTGEAASTSIVTATPTALAASWPATVAQLAALADTYLEPEASDNTRFLYVRYFGEYATFAGDAAALWEPATLERWKAYLFKVGYTGKDGAQRPFTVNALNTKIAAVRSVVRQFEKKGHLAAGTHELFRKQVDGLKLKSNKERRKDGARVRIRPEEMDAICAAPGMYANGHGAELMHTALLLTLRHTGARISEVVNLRRKDIELYTNEDGAMSWTVLVMGKNETEPARVELGAKAKKAIDAWLAYREGVLGVPSPYVFTGFRGRGDREPAASPITRTSAWELVKHYTGKVAAGYAAAGAADIAQRLGSVKPHDFRRYTATELLRRFGLRRAQQQTRHKSADTLLKHYAMDDLELGQVDSL